MTLSRQILAAYNRQTFAGLRGLGDDTTSPGLGTWLGTVNWGAPNWLWLLGGLSAGYFLMGSGATYYDEETGKRLTKAEVRAYKRGEY